MKSPGEANFTLINRAHLESMLSSANGLLRTSTWLAPGLQESIKTLSHEILGDYTTPMDPKP